MRAASAALAIASVLIFIPLTAHADPATEVTDVTAPEVREARVEVESTLGQMRATSLRVRDQLRTARKRGTKQQITCVDQSLSRSDVALRRARETGDEVLGAYARGDVDGARAARHRLLEIRQAQRLAAAEGTSCTPGAAVAQAPVPGATTVKLQIDPKIAPAQ